MSLVFAFSANHVGAGGGNAAVGMTMTAASSPTNTQQPDEGDNVISLRVNEELVLLRMREVFFSGLRQSQLGFLQTVKTRTPNLRFFGNDAVAQAIMTAAQQQQNITLSGRWYPGSGYFIVGSVDVLDDEALR